MIVVSHRGPYRFEANDDGTFTAEPGAGGLASALGALHPRRISRLVQYHVWRVDRIMLYAVGESKLAKIPSNPCKRCGGQVRLK